MSSVPSSRANPASNLAGLRLAIEYVSLEALKLPRNETRTHSKSQLRRLGRSLCDHGFVVPVTVYGDNIIATGNARVRAARLAGLSDAPVIRLEHLTDEQARLFAIADNKLLEGGDWDEQALRIEFAEITIAAPELDLGRSGFSIGERDVIVGRHRTNELADLDDHVVDEDLPVVSRIGDVFVLGRHRLACGDAQDAAVLESVVNGREVRTVLTDPPYNVKIAGNVSGLGAKVHDEFVMASGEMSEVQFTSFLARAIEATQPHLVDGALIYACMDWRHMGELSAAAAACHLEQLNLLVWAKTNAGMGLFYRSAHELIGLYRHGGPGHMNNVELGANGRNRTNVLHYPGVNSFGKGRNKALAMHPTVKPVALFADLILDSSAPGELILDPFGGSGTTLIAAEKTDRAAALVELDGRYVDATVRRFEAATGETAAHEATGKSFAELTAERAQGEEA